jgi:hypothetical protein
MMFFVRGRGRGHAVPDSAICDELLSLLPGLKITLVSYGTGARTLRHLGYSVIDLGYPDDNPFFETMIDAGKLISKMRPTIVVVHEEFGVLPTAKIFGAPTVFLTDWMPPPNQLLRYTLTSADHIVFMEEQGIFPEPEFIKGRIKYIGPIMRRMSCTSNDRIDTRLKLGYSDDEAVISVIPGAWANELRAPVFDLVLSAFQSIRDQKLRLNWLAGDDFQQLRARCSGVSNIHILKSYEPTEELIVASDLIITKGNRGTTLEASYLGIPSISLSEGQNPVDEMILNRIRSNIAIWTSAADPDFLARTMKEWKLKNPEDTCVNLARKFESPLVVARILQALADPRGDSSTPTG